MRALLLGGPKPPGEKPPHWPALAALPALLPLIPPAALLLILAAAGLLSLE